MNIKYFYEFKGTDNVLNRVEILCNETVTAKEITASKTPFIIEYPEVKKLEAVQASGATLELISKQIFQFTDLHTDNMQGYLLKFYRASSLYWIGWLDSELYKENLSSFPPYPVTFSGSDFNVLERLKFRDTTDSRYTDITPLLTQLKRCFDKLALPFNKLYIGCSTVPDGITLSVSETALHKLYIQSSNFYDEDGEPMTCREVVESILEPFGLMLVQRDASIYIYDYNTIKAGGVMKCYNFNTLAYVGDTETNTILGDLPAIGFASADSSLGYEEMINNVEITSSMYATLPFAEAEVNKTNIALISEIGGGDGYRKETYRQCEGWDGFGDFILYTKKDDNNSLIGASCGYNPNTLSVIPAYRIQSDEYVFRSEKEYYLNIKLEAYVNTKNNPFDDNESVFENGDAKGILLRCNAYIKDITGKPYKYYTNADFISGWTKCGQDGTFPEGKCILLFCNKQVKDGNVLNKWVANSDQRIIYYVGGGFITTIRDKDYGAGLNIPMPEAATISGFVNFEITNYASIEDPSKTNGMPYPKDKVKNILFNNVSIGIKDSNENDVSNTDYEFKSYVNKKVATDFEKKDLKVVSCNEDMLPVGKGNILKYVTDHYELQLSFTRAGQTDILERLLMCSIHSNFTTKNRVISVDIKMGDNPAMRTVTYNGIIDTPGMLVTGSVLDFSTAVTRITAVDFSGDTAKLSSIAYE